MTFVLVVIDLFSKFLLMQSLQDKNGQRVTAAFKHVLRKGRRLTYLRSENANNSDLELSTLY